MDVRMQNTLCTYGSQHFNPSVLLSYCFRFAFVLFLSRFRFVPVSLPSCSCLASVSLPSRSISRASRSRLASVSLLRGATNNGTAHGAIHPPRQETEQNFQFSHSQPASDHIFSSLFLAPSLLCVPALVGFSRWPKKMAQQNAGTAGTKFN